MNATASSCSGWARPHAKEAELEADLTAHIALTEKQSYKKRLRQHLTETRDHKRRVASRIKKLGGSPTAGTNIPGVPSQRRHQGGDPAGSTERCPQQLAPVEQLTSIQRFAYSLEQSHRLFLERSLPLFLERWLDALER